MLLFLTLVLLPVQAWAQGMTLIRDTEIEETLRQWCTPIFRAAGLNPDAVKIILVQSTDFNAFVAGGSNIFIYTGMIDKTKTPGELLGVIAHETGHIAGGHLIRGREAMERATYESMLAMILGAGAGLAGAGDAAGGIMAGGQSMAMGSYLAHSRVQESSADQAGLRYLEDVGYSPKGMASLLEQLKDQEYMPASQQSEYMRTHPLTADRLAAVEEGVRKSKVANNPYPAGWDDTFKRIKAKLMGFTQPQQVAWVYSDTDNSVPSLYARAIAAYRRSEKNKALTLTDQLIAQDGKNPYYYELKGQMLRDFSQVNEAAAAYRKAIALKPDAALIRIDLAQVLIEMGPQHYAEAEENLDKAQDKERTSGMVHRLLATIYGRQGDEARAQYHLAEEAALKGNIVEAQKLLTGAMPGLKPGTPDYRNANDLKVYLDSKPKKDDKKKR